MGEQLSFENELYERERKLLFLVSELGNIRNSLHYQRTKAKATETALKAARHKKAMQTVETKLTDSLEWIAQIEYYVSKDLSEIGSMQYRKKQYFYDRISLNNLALDAISTPIDIYNKYIKIYRDATALFNKYGGTMESLSPCNVLIREFYVSMQEVGKELEEVL